jgi:hypothetical protein
MAKGIGIWLALLLAGCSATVGFRPDSALRPTVALMTDLGTDGDAVAIMRGVVLSIARDATVVDVTHGIPRYDVEAGAQVLLDVPEVYPPGTVFAVVVDPGVGTARKPIAVLLSNGCYLVGPDNGLLSLAMDRYGVVEARAIEDRRFLREPVSSTFHGRDVFAPAAAHLALGSPPFAEIGSKLEGYVRLSSQAAEPVARGSGEIVAFRGVVTEIDEPYGNVWTNIRPSDLAKLKGQGDLVVEVGDRRVRVPLVSTFGDVPKGSPLAYWNSRGSLALAVSVGDAARSYRVERGMELTVRRLQ